MNKIGWTDQTWNPVAGCSKVSPGCLNCYAERMAKRLKGMGLPQYQDVVDQRGWTGRIRLAEYAMDKPLAWHNKRVFVGSMSDLLHESIPLDASFLAEVFGVMALAQDNIFQVLTKRAYRLYRLLTDDKFAKEVEHYMEAAAGRHGWCCGELKWPLPNVWGLVTAENQKYADERIPDLLRSPFAARGASIEPMLGPVYLGDYLCKAWSAKHLTLGTYLDQVILGCETGPGRRHTELDWMLDVAAQTLAAGVPLYVKQVEINGKVSHNPAEWPVELRRREFPKEKGESER